MRMNTIITKDDLLMMLDKMNECGAERIKLEVSISSYDGELRYIDFDAWSKDNVFIRTLLTLE